MGKHFDIVSPASKPKSFKTKSDAEKYARELKQRGWGYISIVPRIHKKKGIIGYVVLCAKRKYKK